MNWKIVSIEDLKKYKMALIAVGSIDEELETLETQVESIRSSTLSSVPMHGGGTQYEDKLLNIIIKKDNLKRCKITNSSYIRRIKRGLSVLSPEEKTALTCAYIDQHPNYIDEIMHKVPCEKSKAYNLRNEALYKFTVAMYGVENYIWSVEKLRTTNRFLYDIMISSKI